MAEVLKYLVVAVLLATVALLCFLLYNVSNIKCYVRKERFYFDDPDEEITDKAAENLSKAIKINTVTGKGDMKMFHAFLEATYPTVHARMKREFVNDSLLFHLESNSDEKPIIFLGHMDTVDVSGEWRYPPFSGEIAEGFVWGRGTADCKHVVISLMEAMETLLKTGFKPERDIYFAFGHDEETGGVNGATQIAKLLEERGVQALFVMDEGGNITKAPYSNRGAAIAKIATTEKGVLNIKLTANGKSGHSSKPEAHTTVGILAEAICRIEACPMPPRISRLTEEYLLAIAPFMEFSERFYVANRKVLGVFALKGLCKNKELNALLRNTFAVTMAQGSNAKNIIGSTATANINIRMLPKVKAADVVEHIKKVVAPLNVDVEIDTNHECTTMGSNDKSVVSEITESIKKRFGASVIVTRALMLGGSDCSHYENISTNTLRFVPFVFKEEQAARVHAEDECMPINSLGAGVEFYIEYIDKMSKI